MATLSKVKQKILDTEPVKVEPQEQKLSTHQEKIEGSKANRVIGDNLAKFRTEAGITRQELANMLSLTTARIGYFETGRKIISARYLAKLMKIFHKDIQDFLANK
jgi:hypothetical protein